VNRTVRRAARELWAVIGSLPLLMLLIGLLSYSEVVDDGWPWWLPVVLFVNVIWVGVVFGWLRKTRRQR
jgi:fatty acid desaturase